MPEATTKPRPKTDNSSLRLALMVQPGEQAKRVEVKRDGREVGYSELERMKLKDLLQCDISVLSVKAKFMEAGVDPFDKQTRYNYFWGAFGGTEVGARYTLDKSAVEALEMAYSLAVAAAGGI